MLQVSGEQLRAVSGNAGPHEGQTASSIISLLNRQRTVIALAIACSLVLGALYCFTATPQYTSTALLLIDARKNPLLGSQNQGSDTPIDAPTVDSQVELITSDNVLNSVIADLKLMKDPEFIQPSRGLVGSIFAAVGGIFGAGDTRTEEELSRAAIGVIKQNLRVRRVGLTYVLEISYRSPNPWKSAQIANAVADGYITDQLQAKYTATKRASVWMGDRIAELRDESNTAATAVQTYKAANNIVETGRGSMVDQQLAEVSSQLVLARAQTAEAQARLDRTNEILKGGMPEASVTDALRNDVVSRLRNQLLDTLKRADEWSKRYGPTHVAVLNLRSEIEQLRRSLLDELNRIAETYKSEFEIAQARQVSLEQSLASLIQKNALGGQAGVKLRELEAASQTYRALYESFLQRLTEATQQQSFPITEARVITPAARPFNKSHPQTTLIMAVCLLGGAAAGLGFAFLRDKADKTVRSAAMLEDDTGLDCLAHIPFVATGSASKSAYVKPRDVGRQIPNDALLSHVVDDPFSLFTESVRSVKVSIDLARISGPVKTIGIISSLPNEGKTTIASNLASLIVEAGQSCILIDADLRNPSLTKRMTPDADAGLIELLLRTASLSEVVQHVGKLDILPAVLTAPIANTSELLRSGEMMKLLSDVGAKYDYVILDLPPLAPVVDVRAIIPMIDRFVLTVEWATTHTGVVTEAVNRIGAGAREKVLGFVLNKVNLKAMGKYDVAKGYYYNKHYARYGSTS